MSFPTWTPLVPNGWHPRVWVDGPDIYVTYGFGQCWLSQLRFDNGVLLQVRGARLDGDGDGGGGMAGHWIRPYVLTWWRERGDVGKDYWERYELDVRGADWRSTLVAGPSIEVGGNWMSASGGHTMERKPGMLRYDGTVVSTQAGTTAQKAEWMTGAETWDNLVIRQWRNGVLLPARWQTVTPLHEMGTGENGSFAYGGYGAIFGSHADDPNQQDLTVTPWRWEGTPFLWTRLTGEVWLATITWHPNDPQMGTLLRPWGAKDVVYVPVPAVHVHVDETPDYWFVATCGDTGSMTLSAVPTSTPRQILTTPDKPIDPPIEPPGEDPKPAITITSFDPTSGPAPLAVHAVAKLEDRSGPVDTVQWLKRKDGTSEWTVDATNPATDLDHTYQFPEGVWFLAVKANGPGGTAQTLFPRKVTATAGETPIDPPIEPPVEGEDRMHAAWKLDGKFIGVDPAIPEVVYHDRDEPGGWETLELVERPGSDVECDARFIDANVFFCVNPEGGFETRPAGGGAWESFSIAEQLNGVLLVNVVREGRLLYVFEAVRR